MKLGTLRLCDTSALRPGRAALALDFMEEFRRWADRLALTLINRGQLAAKDFAIRAGGGVSFLPDARKAVVVAHQKRKRYEINHPLIALSLPLGLNLTGAGSSASPSATG